MAEATFRKILYYAVLIVAFFSMLYILFGKKFLLPREKDEETSRDIGIKAVSYNGCRFLIFFAKEPKGPFTVIPDPTDCGCEKQNVSPITPKAPTEQKEKEGKPRQKEI